MRLLLVALPLLAGCLLDAEEHAERMLCRELRDALDDDTPAPVADANYLDEGPLILSGDAYLEYTPNPSGTKMFASTSRLRLQVIDEFGRYPDVELQEESTCDELAMRWTLDLEPRLYYLLIDEVEDEPFAMMAVTIED